MTPLPEPLHSWVMAMPPGAWLAMLAAGAVLGVYGLLYTAMHWRDK